MLVSLVLSLPSLEGNRLRLSLRSSDAADWFKKVPRLSDAIKTRVYCAPGG